MSIRFCIHFPSKAIDFAGEVIEKRRIGVRVADHPNITKTISFAVTVDNFPLVHVGSEPSLEGAFFNYLPCKINGLVWKMCAKTN